MSIKFSNEDYIETAYGHAQSSFWDRYHPRNVLIREIPSDLAKELPGIIYQKILDFPDMKGKVSYMEFVELVGIIKEQNLRGEWKYFRDNHKGKWLVLDDVFSEPLEPYSVNDLRDTINSMRANNCNESVGFIAFERPGAKLKEHIRDYGSPENKHFESWVNFFMDWYGIDLEKETARHVKWKNKGI